MHRRSGGTADHGAKSEITIMTSLAPPTPMQEVTLGAPARAMALGALIGVILAAGNVYAGLKTGYIDGGSITAALLGSAILGIARQRGASSDDVNLTQTVASSAAVMSFASGVSAPIPALALSGLAVSGWTIFGWGISLAVIGIALAWALRRRLIGSEDLPFPTGRATAEVIEALNSDRRASHWRLASLTLAAIVAAAITWWRDGPSGAIPQGFWPPISIGGVGAAALTLGVSYSPLMAATGVLMGIRIAASMALGALVAWGALAPWAVHEAIVKYASYASLVPILLWPGLALLVSSALTTLTMSWRTLRRSLRDVRLLLHSNVGATHPRRILSPPKIMLGLLLTAAVTVVSIGTHTFGIPIFALLIVLPVGALLSAASARAAGETDQAPIGQVGAFTQLGMGSQGVIPSLAAGAAVSGMATQTAQTLWAFKAGQRLGTPPGLQIVGQLLGALIGAAVVVPVYALILAAYPLGSETMPAPAALAWKATADAAAGTAPFSEPLVLQTTIAAALLGVVLTLCSRESRWWLPSPTALGAAFVLPASATAAMLLGAALFGVVERARPGWSVHGPSLAAGGIVGESVIGLLLATLAAAAGR
jgi:putative OPT family oligopeptide transporter